MRDMIPNRQRKMTWCQGAFAAILLLTYFAMSAAVLTAGNRGSDQFWYENEMGSLLAGAAPCTNCYFPGPIFRNGTLVGSNYFIHHTAAHYLAWPASTIFGPFHGWVGTSILLTVLSAMLLADLAFRLTARKIWALATFGGYLLAPPVVWYSLNMLQESYFAFWITLSLYAVVRSARSVWWGFIAFSVLALGKLLHPFFPILFFVYVVTSPWILPSIKQRRVVFAMVGVAAGLFVLAFYLEPMMETTHTGTSTLTAAEGHTHLSGYMEYDVIDPTFSLLATKTVRSVKKHFQVLKTKTVVFYIPFYTTIVGVMMLVFRIQGRRKRLRILSGFALLAVAAYAGITCVHQVQARYCLLAFPATFLGFIIWLSGAHQKENMMKFSRIALIAMVAWVIVSVGVDTMMVRSLCREAKEDHKAVTTIQKLLNEVPSDQRIAGVLPLAGSTQGIRMAYSTIPRPFLHLLDFHLQDPRTSTVLAKYRPEYILIDNQIPNKQAVSDLYAFGMRAALVKQGATASLYQVSWMPLP